MARMTIKSRLLVVLLIVGATAGITVSLLAYQYSQKALKERVFSQLTSLRASRTEQIKSYIQNIEEQIATMRCDPSVIDAAKNYRAGVAQLKGRNLDQAEAKGLARYYREKYLPQLKKVMGKESLLENHFPQELIGQYLQYHYMLPAEYQVEPADEVILPLANSEALEDSSTADETPENDEKELTLVEVPLNESLYTQTQNKFDSYFRRVTKTEGFLDLFLINPEDHRILYSVEHGVDFATNLEKGPYSNSNLADVTQRAMDGSRCSYVVSDFDFYIPAFGAPAAFIASPIYDGTEQVGVLAVEFPMDEINDIMTGGGNWKRDGFGESGESYLVGQDLKMRSMSRFLMQESDAFLAMLDEIGVSASERKKIKETNTTVLLQSVDTAATQGAANGRSGTEVVDDYRGVPVLSSYAPLRLDNFDWYILAEIDAAEAFQPLYELRRVLVISAVSMLLAITALAMILANVFTRPIRRFVTQTRRVTSGAADTLSVPTGDEFGALAQALNQMILKLKAATRTAENSATRFRRLLDDVLPEHMANRLSDGETELLDTHQNVTVLSARLIGIDEFVSTGEAREAVISLNELISELDEEARDLGLDTVKSSGGDYTAICGASIPRLDHVRRVIDFSLLFREKLEKFNVKYESHLRLSVGIDTGMAVTGMIGRQNLIYDVWGPVAESARTLNLISASGDEEKRSKLAVSARVRESVEDFYEFKAIEGAEHFLLQGPIQETP